jgi:hypothetical protein
MRCRHLQSVLTSNHSSDSCAFIITLLVRIAQIEHGILLTVSARTWLSVEDSKGQKLMQKMHAMKMFQYARADDRMTCPHIDRLCLTAWDSKSRRMVGDWLGIHTVLV